MSRPRFLFHFGFLTGVLSLVAIVLVVLGAAVVWIYLQLPDVSVLKNQYPVVEYHGKDEPPTVRLQKARPAGWISLDSISKVAQRAVVISEDATFFQHGGYDPDEIKEALAKDLERHRFSHGASTITQQVVRNVFLTKDKNIVRKLKELYLAVRLDDSVSKRRTLEVYFNIAEWGEGVFGIGGAARMYFHKEPAELTAREGAFLAMLLPSPIRYGQSFRKHMLTPYAHKIINSVLDKMAAVNYLTPDDAAAEKSSKFAWETSFVDDGSHGGPAVAPEDLVPEDESLAPEEPPSDPSQ